MSRAGRSRWAVNERFVIGRPGNPMLERWRLLQTPWFGVYVHFLYREDLDLWPHDHPWAFVSLILRGGYVEELFDHPARSTASRRVVRRRWSLHRFPLEAAHRIVSTRPRTTTLCLVGRKACPWGFYVDGRWQDYRDFLGLRGERGLS